MAVWPLLGRRRRRDDGPAADADAPSSASPPPLIPGALGALPPSLGEFLMTAPGASWLAEELSDIHIALPTLRAPFSVREFNALVLQAYNRLLTTDAGRRLASTAHAQERAAEDVLQVPLFIVEDFVRQRLRSTLARNWGRYAVIVCTRATAATAAVRVLKAGCKWLIRRHLPEGGRARRFCEVALDLLVPTELYGALAAVGLVVARLHHELSEIQAPPLTGGGGGGEGGEEGGAAAASAEALLKRGTAAGRR